MLPSKMRIFEEISKFKGTKKTEEAVTNERWDKRIKDEMKEDGEEERMSHDNLRKAKDKEYGLQER